MKRVIIIAEAGVNHNGDIAVAKKMISVAAEAGADYVKFQSFKAEQLASRHAGQAAYQKRNTGKSGSQIDLLKKLELSAADHRVLIEYCKKCRIKFFSTAFDLDSLRLLRSLGQTMFKVPSGEITNFPYLRNIARFKKPVIVSTGMSTVKEIGEAMNVLMRHGVQRNAISLLHCNTEYPTPFRDVNLSAMLSMRKQFGVGVGYSDHTQGIEVPIAAVALGATIIEKHFTLDKRMKGPDHKASIEPSELIAMVRAIRNIEQAIGDGVKRPSPSEKKNIAVARKSIVAVRDIRRGEIFTEKNIGAKRPGTGISPMRWNDVIGRKAVKDFSCDDLIVL